MVASYPGRSLKARTIEVNGYSVKVVGVEDLIVDRLAAAKFWKSERDEEQARALLNTFRKSIDYGYLEKTAAEENVRDLLKRVRGKIGRHRPKG
jgi:predicted nucleotidyltransferase